MQAARGTGSTPYAHATAGGERRHILRDHLAEVGRLAAGFVALFADPAWGSISGRLHDLGKFAASFQQMLAAENGYEAHVEGDTAGPRDHSTAGAIHVLDVAKDGRGLALALLIAGHHGGLPAAEDLVKRRVPEKRRDRCLERAVEGGAGAADMALDAPALPAAFKDRGAPGAPERFEMWVRMLFSCLCDADFLDTEAFFDSQRSQARRAGVPMATLRARLEERLDLLAAGAAPGEVNSVRAEVLGACRASAALPPGFFSLTVPTGGGKTLASMAFALDHAAVHGLRRAVVAIPFTSIIEQSADAYREALGGDAVLEHHSALAAERDTNAARLAAENWDAPIVVTTTVQLFESLFANRPAACRKLHRLARSVIILDEAQTLPPGLLEPLLDGLRSLVADFGATVVFCTATRPALGDDRIPAGLPGIREIVPQAVRAFERLRRVRTRWPSGADPTRWEALADEVAGENDVLAIVHRRADARALCEAVDERLGDHSTVHLSALMCPEHRSEVLSAIKEHKRRGLPVRVVSTQLVEAGVDLDFAVVYRALGGLDAMAQAAGRCNREGRLAGLGELRLFLAPTPPPPGVPVAALAVTRGLLAGRPELDLFSSEVFGDYFEQLYASRNLDAKGIQELRRKLDFPEVALRFRLIEDGWSAPVVVPYRDAGSRLAALERQRDRERLRALQRLTVNVAERERDRWLVAGAAREVAGLVVAVGNTDAYDGRFGLLLDRAGTVDPESLIA